MLHAWFGYLVCEVLAPVQLLPCPKEAIAEPLTEYLLRVLLYNVTMTLKEALTDHAWVQLIIAAIHSMC